MPGVNVVVTMLIAAHAQRVQEVMEAFRRAGATAPERARSLAALGVAHAAEAEELARAGVLVPGAAPDTWYLSEAAVVARRRTEARSARRVLAIALLVGVALVLVAGGLLAIRHA